MALANVTVTVTEPNVTVSSDNVNVSVSATTTNVVVGNATITSNADIRNAISLTNVNASGGLSYDSSNGVFTYSLFESNGITLGGDGSLSVKLRGTDPYLNFSSNGIGAIATTTGAADSLIATQSDGNVDIGNLNIASNRVITVGDTEISNGDLSLTKGYGVQTAFGANVGMINANLTFIGGYIGGALHRSGGFDTQANGPEVYANLLQTDDYRIASRTNFRMEPDGPSGATSGVDIKNLGGNLTLMSGTAANEQIQLGTSGTPSNVKIGGGVLESTGNITTTANISASAVVGASGNLTITSAKGVDIRGRSNTTHAPRIFIDGSGTNNGAGKGNIHIDLPMTDAGSGSSRLNIRGYEQTSSPHSFKDVVTIIPGNTLSTSNTISNALVLQGQGSIYSGYDSKNWIFWADLQENEHSDAQVNINSTLRVRGDLLPTNNSSVSSPGAGGSITDSTGQQTFGQKDQAFFKGYSKHFLTNRLYIPSSSTSDMTQNMNGQGSNSAVIYWEAGDQTDATPVFRIGVSDDWDGGGTGVEKVPSLTTNDGFLLNNKHDFTGTSQISGILDSTANFSTTANVVGSYLHGDGSNITGVSTLTNSQVVAHIATVPLTVGGNLDVNGNLEVAGNLNYRNVEDLFVRDQSITLNANAASDATVEIIANRPVAGSNTVIRWNETDDKWQFSNDGSTYNDILTPAGVATEVTNTLAGNVTIGNITSIRGITGSSIDLSNAGVVQSHVRTPGTVRAGSGLDIVTDAINGIVIRDGDNTGDNPTIVGGNFVSANATFGYAIQASNVTYSSGGVQYPAVVHRAMSDATGQGLRGANFTIVDMNLHMAGNGNIQYATNIDADANITAGANINAAGGTLTGVLESTGNITTTANVTGNYFIGNGALLTGISSGGGGGITNAQAQAYIESNGLDATANLTTTANVSGAYLLGNGSAITGVTTSIVSEGSNEYFTTARANSAIGAYTGNLTAVTTTGNIITTGNLQINPDTTVGGLKGFTFDSATNRLGLGTTTPEAAIHIESDNDFDSQIFMKEYKSSNAGNDMRIYKAAGTVSSPTTLQAGNRIFEIQAYGYDGSSFQNRLNNHWFVDSTVAVSSGVVPMGWELKGSTDGTSSSDSLLKLRGNGALQMGTMGANDSNTGVNFQVLNSGEITTSGAVNTTSNINLNTSIEQQTSNTTTAVADVQAYNNGTLTEDSIAFSGGQIFADGTEIYYQNATNGSVTPLNNRTYYLKYNTGDGGRYELFDDSGFTTGSRRTTGGGFYTSGVGEVVTSSTSNVTVCGNINVGGSNVVIEGLGGNVTTAANVNAVGITATGNVAGNYFIGNGSLLTGISGGGGSSYGNSDVATFLDSDTMTANIEYTGNLLVGAPVANANITINDAQGSTNGSIPVDSISFTGGQIFSDATPITFHAGSDPKVSALDGLVFYLKWDTRDGGRFALYDNSGLTTGSTRISPAGGFSGSNIGTAEYESTGVSQANVEGTLNVSGAVDLATGGGNATFGGNVITGSSHKLYTTGIENIGGGTISIPSLRVTDFAANDPLGINVVANSSLSGGSYASPFQGAIVYVTGDRHGSRGAPCYWSGSEWRYFSDDANVTI